MISALTLASLLIGSPGGHATVSFGPAMGLPIVCIAADETIPDDRLKALYEGGRSFADFLGQATSRTELWHGNYGRREVLDMALVERARAVPGTWRFLAVAVDTCSDSVSTLPYLAHLVELVEGLEMRVIDSTVGREIMEAHPTPDGRAATPTVVLLDAEWNEVGCFIERPRSLQDWVLENSEGLSRNQIYERKMAWYEENAGHETVAEFVAMLEAAAEGRKNCGR